MLIGWSRLSTAFATPSIKEIELIDKGQTIMSDRKRLQPKRIPEKLLAIRQRLGLSQTEMKKHLNFPVHYGRLSDYERGRRVPPMLALLAYARTAGVPLESIIDDEINLEF